MIRCNADILHNSYYITVDGGWGEWANWSACSKTCGGVTGTRSRSRQCDTPATQYGGADCADPGTEAEECVHDTVCPGMCLL